MIMGKKNRVYCLYRVSTKGQVEKDDIPMQKQRCREFAESQGWTILKEFAEKGVSCFKVAAADRDAIQEIRKDAEERSLIFCWYLCSTAWGDGMMKRLSWWSGSSATALKCGAQWKGNRGWMTTSTSC